MLMMSCSNCWIDVRDLGLAHVKAIQVPEAANERIIVSAGTYKWQDWGKCTIYHTYLLNMLIE